MPGAGRRELMQLALQEAQKARGRTRPNPMVGCVIAKGGKVVAVGHHVRAGTPHAEAVALRRAGAAARGADVYITLEPCDHQGRTGPCTQALIDARVRRVFVGTRDPNPIVNGRGLKRLRTAGIEVEVGLLRRECQHLNEAYEHAIRTELAFVVAKIAQSLDGRVATRAGESKWITGEAARRAGHTLRSIHDAILVGSGTVLADNPTLTCRVRGGRDPHRVVLDSRARTPVDANVVRVAQSSSAPTLIFVSAEAPKGRCEALVRAGAHVVRCAHGGAGLDLHAVVAELARRELLSVLIEGGPSVIGAFFDTRLVCRLEAFIAPLVIGGVDAKGSIAGLGPAALQGCPRLRDVHAMRVGDDYHITGYPVYPPDTPVAQR